MTSSKEFVRWRVYLDQEPNEFNTLHYYIALVAMMIAKVNAKDQASSDKMKLDDFLLKFEVRGSETNSNKVVSPEQAELNKKMFLASLGVVMKNTPTRKPPRTRGK